MVIFCKEYFMKFKNERLTQIRENLGINKAEAARRLNMSAMGYGRYEKGEREPSFQTVSFIADTFGTTTDYLYGITDTASAETITISSISDPELFHLVCAMKKDSDLTERLLAYASRIEIIDK